MLLSYLLLILSLTIANEAISAAHPPSDLAIERRYAPHGVPLSPREAFRRETYGASISKRQTQSSNGTVLDSSWNNAVLLAYNPQASEESGSEEIDIQGQIEITCTTCYMKGTATVDYTVDGNITQYKDELVNITETLVSDFADAIETFVLDGNQTAIKDLDFNVSLPQVPEYKLHFQLDGMELYMELNAALSVEATYTLNLYTSETIFGLEIGGQMLGVVFKVDLILDAQSEVDIAGGFHIQLEDGLAIDIALFSDDFSSMTFNGGKLEFLPVTIYSPGATLTAVLRLGIFAGIEESIDLPGKTFDSSAGVMLGIFTNLANFTTSIANNDDGDGDCDIRIDETYQFALGATAGASVAVGPYTWSNEPETQTPIFFTTLADICAARGEASTTTASVSTFTKRQDQSLTPTTTTTEVVYTAVGCESAGLINCPASLQTVNEITSTKTLTTSVAVGSDVDWDQTSTTQGPISAIPFGRNVKDLGTPTTGPPKSYVPPPPPTASATGSAGTGANGTGSGSGSGSGLSETDKIIIGVSVGVGVPAVALLLLGIIMCLRRRRNKPIAVSVGRPGQSPVASNTDLQMSKPMLRAYVQPLRD